MALVWQCRSGLYVCVMVCAVLVGCSKSASDDLGRTGPSFDASQDSVATSAAQPSQTSIPVVSTKVPLGDATSLVNATPLKNVSRQKTDGPLFERIPADESSVTDAQMIDKSHPLKRVYVGPHACGGIAVGDINNDGRVDMYAVNNAGQNRLYLQSGEFRFSDVTEAAGVGGGDAWGAGVSIVDIDGDRDMDIYVCNYQSPNQLFINDGAKSPTFTEKAAAFGLDIMDGCVMPYFCDYDRDGDLDVYIVCYRLVHPGGHPDEQIYTTIDGKVRVKTKYERYYEAFRLNGRRVYVTECGCEDYLLRNEGADIEGDIVFTDVTKQAGISGPLMGVSASWWDYDEDGFPDLYVASDFDHADRLYRNRGDGTFENDIRFVLPHTAYSAMGSSIADVDGNGHLDLFVLDMASTTHFKEKINMGEMGGIQQFVMDFSQPRQIMRNSLYLNTGTGRMAEAALMSGLAKSDWSWSPLMEDFDNDGHVDVVVTNGMSRNLTDSDVKAEADKPGKTEWDFFESEEPYREQDMAFKNMNGLRFVNVSNEWGLDRETMSFAAATADFDGDGDLDMVFAHLNEPPSLFRNQSGGNRITVELDGPDGNPEGIGAQVIVETETKTQLRYMMPTRGFAATSQAIAHFGLGDAATVKHLTVVWPDGARQVHSDIGANQHLKITKAGNAVAKNATQNPTKSSPPAMYRPLRMDGVERHVDADYDDFQHQPLLPNRYSQLGPCMAWGDVDGDGRLDLFIGGAAGAPGMLYLAGESAGGSIAFAADATPFESAKDSEDMGALFLDVDGDDDMDLYVASGSYEIPAGDERLRDRLYLNDGGDLRLSTGIVPDIRAASSVVTAADIDHDGDLDLFVGSRIVPQQYPVIPESYLLSNESTDTAPRFVDRTAEYAPELLKTGLVTSAAWSDVNSDGWSDLLVTHEWGPVKLFLNREGRLTDETEQAGLATKLGWWNGLAVRDLDHDGDMDFVATNFGLNTKYKASAEKPVYVYYGDYGSNGRMNIVEAKASGTGLLPVRGKSCSSGAMPHLNERFSTFRDFATASLAEIYTDKCLTESLRHEVNTLESGVFFNRATDGSVRFEFVPLPRIAQISPGFGVVAAEVNGDANPDIYLVHNFFTPQRETGRMDGGLSQLLLGVGDGQFEPVATKKSGLQLPGDAKSLTVVDINDDGRPDFVATRNNDFPKAFIAADNGNLNTLRVSLQGDVGNRQAIGAVVKVTNDDGQSQVAEMAAGASYLSQSAPYLFFGANTKIETVEVRWPDGSARTYPALADWAQGGTCILNKNETN